MDYLKPIDYLAPEFAEFYDELPLWSARFAFYLLDQAPLKSRMTVLDIGAGTGFLSIELAQRCRDSQIIAVDPWQAAITRLDRKLARLNIHNVRTIACDAAKVELEPESVDLIVSNLGINNFDDPDAVLKTCHRLARPGAMLLMTTNLIGHMAEFYEIFRKVMIEVGHNNELNVLDAHIAHRATTESVQSRLATANFTVQNVTTHSFQDRFLDGTSFLRHFFIRLGFLPDWKKILPAESAQAMFEVLESRLNERAAKMGELSLTIPAACIIAKKP
jgi:arsenite methyltransferase